MFLFEVKHPVLISTGDLIHNEQHRLSNQKNFVYQAEIGD